MPATILIIEDEALLREEIAELLTYEGFIVKQAKNGLEGYKTALEKNPDLILCDIMMPDLSGYDVLEKLRGEKDFFTPPFIFTTALSDRQNYRQGMNLGADDYLTKPFTRTELISAINSRLKQHNARENHLKLKIDKIELQLQQEISGLQLKWKDQSVLVQKYLDQNQQLQKQVIEQTEILTKETLRTVEINNIIENIKAQVETELKQKNITSKERMLLLNLRNKISSRSLISDNLTVFQLRFNQTYPHFITRVAEQFPNLTQYEIVLISATLMGFNTNQLGEILNISADSVRKSRYRLKKKIGLRKSEDFVLFIHSLNKPESEI